MNVFLWCPDHYTSFSVLDVRRLGKQRVELKQIIIALENGGAWSNHPATVMWRGHTGYAAYLGTVCCKAWTDRGYNDSLTPWFKEVMKHHGPIAPPQWLVKAMDDGDCPFFEDVRANLVRKSDMYKTLWPDVEPKEGYRWPLRDF